MDKSYEGEVQNTMQVWKSEDFFLVWNAGTTPMRKNHWDQKRKSELSRQRREERTFLAGRAACAKALWLEGT